MLTLGIRYLNGWAMAKQIHDVDRPEWPPHPDRVFMALAAAHFETDGDAKERAVLEWLEGLEPPSLVVSRGRERDVVTTFVPVNDSADPIKKNKPLMPAGSLAIGRDRQPRTFPVVVPESGSGELQCFLEWRDVEPTPEQTQALSRLCDKVIRVGHSASLVQVWVADGEQSAIETSDDSIERLEVTHGLSTRRMRITKCGRLADLVARFNRDEREALAVLNAAVDAAGSPKEKKQRKAELAKRFPTPPVERRPESFGEVGYAVACPEVKADDVRQSHFDSQLIVLRQSGGRRFGLESTLQLTAALRNTVMKHCPVQPPPEWVSGHKPEGSAGDRECGHIAFLPLPHVGADHADGHLLGMALAIPGDVPQSELAACLRDVLLDKNGEGKEIELRPVNVAPKAKHGGVMTLQFDEQQDYRLALKSHVWTRLPLGSKRWATVTPIALDRHAKSIDPAAEIEQIIADACERIGLPRPADVIPTPVSMFLGAPASREMPRIERKRGGKIRQTHAVITFDEPVVGPVLLGAGRYRGYGLCRPLNGSNN
jgi:CRISPR-associated protein Csb2